MYSLQAHTTINMRLLWNVWDAIFLNYEIFYIIIEIHDDDYKIVIESFHKIIVFVAFSKVVYHNRKIFGVSLDTAESKFRILIVIVCHTT